MLFREVPINPRLLQHNNLIDVLESGSECEYIRLLRGMRANGEQHYSFWIEDSPQFTAESFNLPESWETRIDNERNTIIQ